MINKYTVPDFQKNIPRGEYVIVSLANVMHHRNGEVQYRIAWVEGEGN